MGYIVAAWYNMMFLSFTFGSLRRRAFEMLQSSFKENPILQAEELHIFFFFKEESKSVLKI